MAPEQTPGSLVLVIRLSRSIYRRATEDVLGMRLKQYISLNTLAKTPAWASANSARRSTWTPTTRS